METRMITEEEAELKSELLERASRNCILYRKINCEGFRWMKLHI